MILQDGRWLLGSGKKNSPVLPFKERVKKFSLYWEFWQLTGIYRFSAWSKDKQSQNFETVQLENKLHE
jgi:hypothetical protein